MEKNIKIPEFHNVIKFRYFSGKHIFWTYKKFLDHVSGNTKFFFYQNTVILTLITVVHLLFIFSCNFNVVFLRIFQNEQTEINQFKQETGHNDYNSIFLICRHQHYHHNNNHCRRCHRVSSQKFEIRMTDNTTI